MSAALERIRIKRGLSLAVVHSLPCHAIPHPVTHRFLLCASAKAEVDEEEEGLFFRFPLRRTRFR